MEMHDPFLLQQEIKVMPELRTVIGLHVTNGGGHNPLEGSEEVCRRARRVRGVRVGEGELGLPVNTRSPHSV